MNKLLFVILLMYLGISKSNAQETGKKQIIELQTGFFGAWLSSQFLIKENFRIKGEIGIDGSLWGDGYYTRRGLLLSTILSVEPRLYYNYKKRYQSGKDVSNLSSNFASLRISYRPSWILYSSSEDQKKDDVSIIPTWGIRRSINRKFTFEGTLGLGLMKIFAPESGILLVSSFSARVGYVIGK